MTRGLTPNQPEQQPDTLLPQDILTPQQRAKAIAEILSTIALRILQDNHGTD